MNKPISKMVLNQLTDSGHPLIYRTLNEVLIVLTDCYDLLGISYTTKELQRQAVRTAARIALLASWRQSKQIYRFNPELTRILEQQELSDSLPIDVLKNVPHKCLYIQYDNPIGVDGFFAYFDDNEYIESDLELRLVPIFKKHLSEALPILPVHLVRGLSLQECLQVTGQETEKGRLPVDMLPYTGLIRTMINHILYLCSENRDMEEIRTLTFTPKKPTAKKKKKLKSLAAPKPETAQEWDVGSIVIRKFQKAAAIPSQASKNSIGLSGGGTKRPHVRKAHWHMFWTGPRDGSVQRKPILKWIQPVFVNTENASELPVVVVDTSDPASKK